MGQSDFNSILVKLGESLNLERRTSNKVTRQLFLSDTFYLLAVFLSTSSYAIILGFWIIYNLRSYLGITDEFFKQASFWVLMLFLVMLPAGLLSFFISFAKTSVKGIIKLLKRNEEQKLKDMFVIEDGYFAEAKNIAGEILKKESPFAKSMTSAKLKQAINLFEYKIDLLEKGDSSVSEISKSITPIIIAFLVFLSVFGFPISDPTKLNLLPNKDMAMAIASLGLAFNLLVPIIKFASLSETRTLKKCLCLLQQVEIIIDNDTTLHTSRKSLKNSLAHLNIKISDEDIREARNEMWRGYTKDTENEK